MILSLFFNLYFAILYTRGSWKQETPGVGKKSNDVLYYNVKPRLSIKLFIKNALPNSNNNPE